MGYTPLFDSLTRGTLCGRWPDIGLWPIVLSLSDRHGVVDVTPAFLSSVTGLPVDDVTPCMKRFCAPDPGSRSGAAGGARLELLDTHRDWGWRIVNHGIYREKARLAMREIDRIASGENKARMSSRSDPRSPPLTPADPPSDSDSDSDSDKNLRGRRSRKALPTPLRGSRLPADFILTSDRRQIAEAEAIDADRTFASFCDYWRSAAGAKARKCDWDATWRNWCRTEQGKGGAVRSRFADTGDTWRPTE